ncbi:type II toxin-antitoxin system HicA family toxin [Saccharopolyspora tripterygii]
MKRTALVRLLEHHGCRTIRNRGNHEVFGCPCGQHQAPVPRHSKISPVVVQSVEKQLACLPRGWIK